LLKHKYYVIKGGLKYKVPLWMLIFHDWDKFLPYMFTAFATRRCEEKWNEKVHKAWGDHQRRSKHHFEYWIVINPYGFADNMFHYLDIPEVYIREMLADWYGAGYARTGRDEVIEWYEKYRKEIKLSGRTRDLLEKILYEGE